MSVPSVEVKNVMVPLKKNQFYEGIIKNFQIKFVKFVKDCFPMILIIMTDYIIINKIYYSIHIDHVTFLGDKHNQ